MTRAHILIVDDNPVNLKLACSVLEAEGYEVESVEDAEEAIAILRKTSFDLILMDIELPGMDGLTLTRKLKQEERTKKIPVVALTAFAMKGDEQKALLAGCVGYISKPIDTRQLPKQIEEFLQGSRKKGEGT